MALGERVKTLVEMAEKSKYFFVDHIILDPDAAKQHLNENARKTLDYVFEQLSKLKEWHAAEIHTVIAESVTHLEIGMGKIAQPLRVAVTGNTTSPSIDITLELIGRERTLSRLQAALEYIESTS
jgi:glutamyl-tRNA synthetase